METTVRHHFDAHPGNDEDGSVTPLDRSIALSATTAGGATPDRYTTAVSAAAAMEGADPYSTTINSSDNGNNNRILIASSIEIYELREQVKLMQGQVAEAQEESRRSRLLCQQVRRELHELVHTEATKETSESYCAIASLLSNTNSLVEKFALFEQYLRQKIRDDMAAVGHTAATEARAYADEAAASVSADVRKVLVAFKDEIVSSKESNERLAATITTNAAEQQRALGTLWKEVGEMVASAATTASDETSAVAKQLTAAIKTSEANAVRLAADATTSAKEDVMAALEGYKREHAKAHDGLSRDVSELKEALNDISETTSGSSASVVGDVKQLKRSVEGITDALAEMREVVGSDADTKLQLFAKKFVTPIGHRIDELEGKVADIAASSSSTDDSRRQQQINTAAATAFRGQVAGLQERVEVLEANSDRGSSDARQLKEWATKAMETLKQSCMDAVSDAVTDATTSIKRQITSDIGKVRKALDGVAATATEASATAADAMAKSNATSRRSTLRGTFGGFDDDENNTAYAKTDDATAAVDGVERRLTSVIHKSVEAAKRQAEEAQSDASQTLTSRLAKAEAALQKLGSDLKSTLETHRGDVDDRIAAAQQDTVRRAVEQAVKQLTPMSPSNANGSDYDAEGTELRFVRIQKAVDKLKGDNDALMSRVDDVEVGVLRSMQQRVDAIASAARGAVTLDALTAAEERFAQKLDELAAANKRAIDTGLRASGADATATNTSLKECIDSNAALQRRVDKLAATTAATEDALRGDVDGVAATLRKLEATASQLSSAHQSLSEGLQTQVANADALQRKVDGQLATAATSAVRALEDRLNDRVDSLAQQVASAERKADARCDGLSASLGGRVDVVERGLAAKAADGDRKADAATAAVARIEATVDDRLALLEARLMKQMDATADNARNGAEVTVSELRRSTDASQAALLSEIRGMAAKSADLGAQMADHKRQSQIDIAEAMATIMATRITLEQSQERRLSDAKEASDKSFVKMAADVDDRVRALSSEIGGQMSQLKESLRGSQAAQQSEGNRSMEALKREVDAASRESSASIRLLNEAVNTTKSMLEAQSEAHRETQRMVDQLSTSTAHQHSKLADDVRELATTTTRLSSSLRDLTNASESQKTTLASLQGKLDAGAAGTRMHQMAVDDLRKASESRLGALERKGDVHDTRLATLEEGTKGAAVATERLSDDLTNWGATITDDFKKWYAETAALLGEKASVKDVAALRQSLADVDDDLRGMVDDAVSTLSRSTEGLITSLRDEHTLAQQLLVRRLFAVFRASHPNGNRSGSVTRSSGSATSLPPTPQVLLCQRYWGKWAEWLADARQRRAVSAATKASEDASKAKGVARRTAAECAVLAKRIDMICGTAEDATALVSDEEKALLASNPKLALSRAVQKLMLGERGGSFKSVLRALIAFAIFMDNDQKRQDTDVDTLSNWVRLIDEEIRKVQKFLRPPFK